jgi:2-polyprenyl-6-methoxyphenol hydroxylase-like FAD-dependent oxidoreductase
VIPTDDGDLEAGHRLLNWVWYYHLAEDSPELAEAMTDVNGKRHYGTVPRGQISPTAWAKQKALGLSTMPAPIAELIEKTETPFVTRINDIVSTNGSFFNGKLFLVGDALAAFRPHVALSTNQAALHARLLEEVLEGKLKPADWSRQTLRWGRATWMLSIVTGTLGLGSRLALAWAIIKYICLIIGQKLRLVN